MRKIIFPAFVVFICLGVFVTAQTLSNNNFGNYENNTYFIGLNCEENQTLFGCNCYQNNVTMFWTIKEFENISVSYGVVRYKAYFKIGKCTGGNNRGEILFNLRNNPHELIGELEKQKLRTEYMLNNTKEPIINNLGTGRGGVR